MKMTRYYDEALWQIMADLKEALKSIGPGESITFQAPNPDLNDALYPGEMFTLSERLVRHRSMADWVELAEVLGCRLHCPTVVDAHWVTLTLTRLDQDISWHDQGRPSGHTEKYGTDTDYRRIQKFERPHDLAAFSEAVRWLSLPPKSQILGLGVNRGEELGMVWTQAEDAHKPSRLVGIDHSKSAISDARNRYPHPPFEFVHGDLTHEALIRGQGFDCILAINTLQSPRLDGQGLLRRMVKEHLNPKGGLLLGFPNCRYIDHSIRFGAQTKNYHHPEYSVLLKSIGAYRRYLHQQGFVVKVTGRHTLFVVGRRDAPSRGM